MKLTQIIVLFFCFMPVFAIQARAQDDLVVQAATVLDEKAVFATVESAHVVPARARIGGTVAALVVKDGDHVDSGQVLAIVGDEKIALRISALESRIAGLDAEVSRAKTDLDRLKILVPRGAASQSSLDDARRDFDVAGNTRKSAIAEREVLRKQISEGDVLAPVSGRILKSPVTTGAVVMPGDTLAIVAEENYILRLEVPESHARFMGVGDPVRLDQAVQTDKGDMVGKITLVYPQIENGRVIADATVDGLDNYFVGERVRVWILGGKREVIVVPIDYLTVRFGVDYARIKSKSGTMDVPVQRGQVRAEGVEILSGLKAGDVLVMP